MPKSYIVRFTISWRYAYHACGYGRLGSIVFALTDPIAALNPIYCKPSYVAAMVRNTAAAIRDHQWQRRMAALRSN